MGSTFANPALTTAEVAALVGAEERAVRKDVEHGILGTASPPRFSFSALVYFRLIELLGFHLGTEDRRRLYGLVNDALASPKPQDTLEMGPAVQLKVGMVAREMAARIDQFTRWKQKLVTDDRILGGEPVFPRSRLSVRHIGALLRRGASPDEVRADYPYLSTEDMEFAALYAEAYPRVGRPREAGPISAR
jgi:uncharacterized protein (DUF433 family)